MEQILDGHFYNPSVGRLPFEQVMDEIIDYMGLDSEKFYDIIIGCDSSSEENPVFPLVIAVLKTGEGGRFFLKKIKFPIETNKKFKFWKNRVIQEVLLACELACFFRQEFEKRISSVKQNFNYQIRYIHADIGEKGKTRDMVKDLTGLIISNGFEPKIKPEAYIATVIADKFC